MPNPTLIKTIKLVYCLSIDLIGSTQAGLELPTSALDRFNTKLVEQVAPHLDTLGLTDTFIKFIGDGWLVITDDTEKVPALCCLATIMAKNFQAEMSAATGIPEQNVPALRTAVCSGRDLRIELPDGRVDWVGDSARRAVRASALCVANEVLINETVRDIVFRDFELTRTSMGQRVLAGVAKKSEEDFPLYVLGELNAQTVADADAPECYINTLSIIGRQGEASLVARTVSERLEQEAVSSPRIDDERLLRRFNRLLATRVDYAAALAIVANLRETGLAPNVVTYNMLINLAPDYEIAKALAQQMRDEGILPNVVTYNTLINLAPDYEIAKALAQQMRDEGILPNVVTYNTLINLAPDYEIAKALAQQMRDEGILLNVVTYSTLINLAPDYKIAKALAQQMRDEGILLNVVTYSTLINLAPDYSEAKALLEQMRRELIQPNVFTYSTLFSKEPGESARDILDWYWSQPYHHETPIQALIAFYRRTSQLGEALYCALHYTHLEAARSLIRRFGNEAVAYFKTTYDNDPNHPSAAYALGIALMELGRKAEARPFLETALTLATAHPRQAAIQRWLHEIDISLKEDPSEL